MVTGIPICYLQIIFNTPGLQGVLSGASVNHSLGDHYSKSEAYGVTLGGNYVHAKSDNSGSKTPAGSVKGKIGDNSKTNNNANSAQETSKSSIGISGNFSTNNDHTEQTWLDINGDGLPDKIYKDGTVRLNLGYSFQPAELLEFRCYMRWGKPGLWRWPWCKYRQWQYHSWCWYFKD